jgi:hypothetical protein
MDSSFFSGKCGSINKVQGSILMAYAPSLTQEFFVELLDFLASAPTPQRIIDFQPSDALTARFHGLLDKNSEGEMTPEEQSELEAFLEWNHFLKMLKIRARMKLIEL